jgi:hypothetical protein
MEAGQRGKPGQAGESGRGGAGGTGGRGGDPSGTGGQGGPGGSGGETIAQNNKRLGLGNRKRTRGFILMCAVLIMAGLLSGAYVLAARVSDNTDDTDKLARVTQQLQGTTLALCALRDDVERRVQSSQNFLAEHPNGIPGIPARTLRDSINNQQRTIDALSILKCPH